MELPIKERERETERESEFILTADLFAQINTFIYATNLLLKYLSKIKPS